MRVLFILVCSSFMAVNSLEASVPDKFTQKEINYRTYFGDCPSKSSGLLSIIIMKEFEKKHSLKNVKERIVSEKLDEKYFLSNYKISYNPMAKTLRINLECPIPLAKIQVYKLNGQEHYSAILGDNAKMYEPQYEVLMRSENKIKGNLPLVAITTELLDSTAPTDLTNILIKMNSELRQQISEVILSKNNELTIIFAFSRKATSVFMGSELWEEKLTKLVRIVDYIGKSKRYPTTINLLNSKKVVVKFSDKI